MTMSNPPKVIAMTAFDVDDMVVQAVEAGAHSFLSKDAAPQAFQQAVRVVASDHSLFSCDSLRAIVASSPRRQAPDQTPLASLTEREREVLTILATARPTVSSRSGCTSVRPPSRRIYLRCSASWECPTA